MKARFLLLPLAAVTITQPVYATVYMSIAEAQAEMFPGASFTADFRTIDDAQVKAIEKASDTNVRARELKVWRVSTGGWFIVDEAVGKHEFIPFALALDADGAVKGIEILEYRESYGGDVRNPKWRAQFAGKTKDAPLALTKDIQNISGATLSCKHITDAVRRLVATHASILAPI